MKKILILLILAIFITACAKEQPKSPGNFIQIEIEDPVAQKTEGDIFVDSGIPKEKSEEKQEINSWIYQLQNTDFNALKMSDADLLVIDVDDSEFTKDQIRELKKDKIVLSYLSIGEAEDYRKYWQEDWTQGNPSFLDEENSNWPGNYNVMFWHPDWYNIIFSQLDNIIAKGYDGVYLDRIDAYEIYDSMSSINSRQEMKDLVLDISEYSKSEDKNFIVIAQNALELTKDRHYLEAIDGVGKEDTWYDDNKEINNPEEIEILNKLKDKNKLTLVIDYPTQQDKICNFFKKAKDFTSTVSNRELDKISLSSC